ncbi:hypothetical protein VP01_190g1 [Puccinia sorghi]|uniref:Uncharacterized protein n=1 Tax=Puccinia sorghi TaxID=27349 RepID=A0A0L6VCR9_9BASI|nr:hypothetical protein VP01_190g1 [Puccinia sorghi]
MPHLQHSPKGSTAKMPVDELKPEPPRDGLSYSKDEIAGMSSEERQWLTRRQHLIKGEELDLIDYEEDTDLTSAFKVMHLDATGAVRNSR